MAAPQATKPSESSPWRPIFETVRRTTGNQRDGDGVLGSINWLRRQMEKRGANPNVVRNIIYRDKGKLPDKRVLFELLNELWLRQSDSPLDAPELTVLLSPGAKAEQEVLQLLGREKRRAYQRFVSGVRSGAAPSLLITGKSGSGKTLLIDYVQQALEVAAHPPSRTTRIEFSSHDLALTLARLAVRVGVPNETFEARLAKVEAAGAFSVQADAQAELARVILDALKYDTEPHTLLIHVSQAVNRIDSIGLAPLRLNTPDVPRINAAEWLWLTLFEPISQLPHVSILVSMAAVPARALQQLGAFGTPVKLNPPSVGEARRFVRARLPQLSAAQQERLVRRSGKSFEVLRTLTLLAEIREPIADSGSTRSQHLEQLSALVETSGDERMRVFLGAVAVASMPEFPTFDHDLLLHLTDGQWLELTSLAQSFLDVVPGEAGRWRCFSRQLTRLLQKRLRANDADRYRRLHAAAASYYSKCAHEAPTSDSAARYLHHLFEARDWAAVERWLTDYSIRQSQLRALWSAAKAEMRPGEALERIAKVVADHYMNLGCHQHPDAISAMDTLAVSKSPEHRAWTQIKRGEGLVQRGHFEQAEALLATGPDTQDPLLMAEAALVRASILRWRGRLDEAARVVQQSARTQLPRIPADAGSGKLAHVKVAGWAALIAKDQGDLERSLSEFRSIHAEDDLTCARLAFQRGDVSLKLGRLGAAMRLLNDAVCLARRGEAPPPEQARYLARLGTACRKSGSLTEAAANFQAALSVLEGDADRGETADRGFEQAKVQDEQALNLLAEGSFDAAIYTIKRNLDRFHGYQRRHRVDSRFRILRSSLRLALAYWCRGLSQPYHLPLARAGYGGPKAVNADIQHARELVGAVVDRLEGAIGGRSRFGPLYFQSLWLAALVSDTPDRAERYGLAALEQARFPYDKAWCRCLLALAKSAAGEGAKALDQLARARQAWRMTRQTAADGEEGDTGLAAWFVAIELQARIKLGQPDPCIEGLIEAIDEPAFAHHHVALLRAFGEAIEAAGVGHWIASSELKQRLAMDSAPRHMRLPDALITSWQDGRLNSTAAP